LMLAAFGSLVLAARPFGARTNVAPPKSVQARREPTLGKERCEGPPPPRRTTAVPPRSVARTPVTSGFAVSNGLFLAAPLSFVDSHPWPCVVRRHNACPRVRSLVKWNAIV
jgi:hypothetical protein